MKNLIVGQSGGPTAAINASLVGVFETAKAFDFDIVYGMQHGIEGLLAGQYIDLDTQLTSRIDNELLKRTPSSFLGSCRYKLPEIKGNEAVYEALFAQLEELSIACVVYIGGNDSMDTIDKMSRWAKLTQSKIQCIGCPKTIDNDLAITDHTPGFGSAAKYIATVTKELVCDSLVYDLKSVTIIEIMGRNAGWLTAAACLSNDEDCAGVDLICLPETVFNLQKFIDKIATLQKEKKSIVVAVSEGIKLADGTYVCEQESNDTSLDVFGHRRLSGTAHYLSNEISAQLGCKTRAIELNTLQRCSAHMASRTDITEAYQAGGAAVLAATQGKTGKMVTLNRLSTAPYLCTTGLANVSEIANKEKTVPQEWITADGFGVTDEMLRYLFPLIQAELPAIYINGVPKHVVRK